MAQIQIWTRDVDNTEVLGGIAPQHTFFIKVNDDGSREILRGGPNNDGMIIGDIGIVKQEYNSLEQNDGSQTYDYYDASLGSNPLNYQGTTIKTSSQSEIDNLWENAWNAAEDVNSQNYDYEALTQNCNTVTTLLANMMGVSSEVRDFLNQKAIWVPGYDKDFNHSTAERAFDFYEEIVSQAGSAAVTSVDEINDWVSNFIATREFATPEIESVFAEKYSYIVRSNDSLYSISSLYGLTIEELIASNEWLIDENRISSDSSYALIKPGEKLTIPEGAVIDEESDYYKELKTSLTSLTSEDKSELSNIRDLLGSSDLKTFSEAIKSALEEQAQQSLLSSNITDFLTSLSQAEATEQVINRDPLTLDLDNDGIDLVSLSASSTFFDLDNDGLKEQVGWVKGDDGFLVYDSNNNQSIDNITELFGYEDENGVFVSGTEELRGSEYRDVKGSSEVSGMQVSL